MTLTPTLTLTLLPERAAMLRLATDSPIPVWTLATTQFLTISRTATELSIVADERVVPADLDAVRGFRVLRVEGPLPFDAVGIMASLSGALAGAGIAIIGIGTYDTDYVMVQDRDVLAARVALEAAGHRIEG